MDAASMDIQDPSQLVQLDEDGSVNELGIGIIKRLSKSYSYKRTIGSTIFQQYYKEAEHERNFCCL